MRIGIFGGSFDPPHLGHLFMAKTVKETMNLDKIIVVPSYLNPFKTHNSGTPIQRLEMCKINFADDFFDVSDIEVIRGGKSYTYDTLSSFKENYPADELFLMIGSDLIFEFHKWYKSSELLKMAQLICISREKSTKKEQVIKYSREVLHCEDRVHFIEVEPFEVSSTEVRELITENKSVDRILKKGVIVYIKESKLYE